MPVNIQVTLWNRGKDEVRTSEDLERLIEEACDSTFQKSGTKLERQRNKYWWNANIAQQRRECIAIQRKITRENTKLQGATQGQRRNSERSDGRTSNG